MSSCTSRVSGHGSGHRRPVGGAAQRAALRLSALRNWVLGGFLAWGVLALAIPAGAKDDAPELTPEDNQAQVQVAQVVLASLDLYKGEATGKMDAATREALKAFQADVGLEATGVLDLETSEALIQLAELASGVGGDAAAGAGAGGGADAGAGGFGAGEAGPFEEGLLDSGLLDGGTALDDDGSPLDDGSLLDDGGLLDDGTALDDGEASGEEGDEGAVDLDEELAGLSDEEIAELTSALGVECRGFNLETEAAVSGFCADGKFEGEDEWNGNSVVGTCEPSGNLDAHDEESGEAVYGTCR